MKSAQNERDRADQDVLALLTHAFTLFMDGDPVGARLAAQMAAPAVPISGPAQAALGDRLLSIDDPEAAEGALRTACELGTCDGETLARLARSLQAQGRPAEAEPVHRQVLRLDPAHAEAWLCLALARSAAGDALGALPLLRRAARLAPGHAATHLMLGAAEHAAGHFGAAATAREAACLLSPADPAAYVALADSRLDSGRVADAQRALVRASRLDPQNPSVLSRCLHVRHLLPGQGPAVLTRVHQGWQARFGAPVPPRPALRARRGGALRVGLLSPDLGRTSTGWRVRPLLRHHDPARLHLTVLSDRRHEDSLAAELRAHADTWIEVGHLGDTALAHRIRAADLDVLVDLTGHGPGNRLPLFARHRPAPVQVCWSAYPGTTGLRTMDLLITDAVHVTESEDRHYVERVARLAEGAITYDAPESLPDPGPPPRLRAGVTTLAAVAGPARVGETCLDLWAPVLRAMPRARLLLMSWRWSGPGVAEALRAGLQARAVDPRRVILADGESWTGPPRALSHVDVVLDTTPLSGNLRTLEALAVGVPVVTLPGSNVGSRHAAAHLVQAGWPQGIASAPSDFVTRVERALMLPRQPSRFDSAAWVSAFTRALEAAVARVAETAESETAEAAEDALT